MQQVRQKKAMNDENKKIKQMSVAEVIKQK